MSKLIEHTRGAVREVVYEGAISVHSDAMKDVSIGETSRDVVLRSTGKPFIIGALLDGPLAGERFSQKEISAMASSHNGEPEHVAVIIDILARYGIANELLMCGTHEQWHSSSIASVIGNNCSGKHAALLISSKLAGYPLNDYFNPDSKIQKYVYEELRKMLPNQEIGVEIDGCSVPTFVIPLNMLSKLYLSYALNQLGEGVKAVREAHLAAPYHMSGTDRLEGYLIQNYGISVKSGSDGVWALGWNTRRIGLAGKVWSGSEPAVQHAILHVLHQKFELPIDEDTYLQRYYNRNRFDLNGNLIGRIQTCFTV